MTRHDADLKPLTLASAKAKGALLEPLAIANEALHPVLLSGPVAGVALEIVCPRPLAMDAFCRHRSAGRTQHHTGSNCRPLNRIPPCNLCHLYLSRR